MIYYLKDFLFAGEEVHPQKIWREVERDKIKLGSTIVNQVSQDFLSSLFSFSIKNYCLQVSSKL